MCNTDMKFYSNDDVDDEIVKRVSIFLNDIIDNDTIMKHVNYIMTVKNFKSDFQIKSVEVDELIAEMKSRVVSCPSDIEEPCKTDVFNEVVVVLMCQDNLMRYYQECVSRDYFDVFMWIYQTFICPACKYPTVSISVDYAIKAMRLSRLEVMKLHDIDDYCKKTSCLPHSRAVVLFAWIVRDPKYQDVPQIQTDMAKLLKWPIFVLVLNTEYDKSTRR